MSIRKHKKILIINFILILSTFIINLNQVFANEKDNANTESGNLVRVAAAAAGPITPTNISFDSAELIQVPGSKKGYANNYLAHYYKFVPQITGKYTITNSAMNSLISNYVSFSVGLYDSNQNWVAGNGETIILDEGIRQVVRYKSIMSYIFIAGETYYIVVDNVSTGYKFTLSFDQNIEESKKPLLSSILNANKVYNEAVEGNQIGQYKVGSKVILKSAIMAAQQVIGNISSTQVDINNALTTLNNALINFQKMKNTSVTIEKSQLTAAISNANIIHDAAIEGSAVGQYKVGSKAILKSAITIAQVIGYISSTQAEIDNAVITLNSAVTTFQSMKNIIATYEYEYDSKSHRLLYILKDGNRIVEFIYDDNGNLKQKRLIAN